MFINPSAHLLLAAIVAMGILHLVMVIWLLGTRVPAMAKARMTAQMAATPGILTDLPAWARNPADNHNNLFEAPTVFYAMVITVILLGHADLTYVVLAWGYVACRVIHSLIQATVNIVMVRLVFFVLSWIALGAVILRCAFSLL